VCVDTTATANRYRPTERGHSGRKDLSVPRYGRKFNLCFLEHLFFLYSMMHFLISARLILHVSKLDAGGSVRSSREDLYSSRNYRGSNTSLNDGRFYKLPIFLLQNIKND